MWKHTHMALLHCCLLSLLHCSAAVYVSWFLWPESLYFSIIGWRIGADTFHRCAWCRRVRARLNEMTFFFSWYSANIFFVWFDLHLIGRKVNHEAGSLTFDSNKTTKKTSSTRSRMGLILLFRVSQIGEFVQLDVACLWNRREPRERRAVGYFTDKIHRSREAGSPEQPQREVRRPLAQGRPSAAPQKNTRPSQTQFFIPLDLANHTSTD